MSNTQSLEHDIEQIGDEIKHAAQKYYEYGKLKFFYELTKNTIDVVKFASIGALLLLGTVFASIAGAIGLGISMGYLPYGFLVVAGLYVVFALIIYMFRKQMENFIVKRFSKSFFE